LGTGYGTKSFPVTSNALDGVVQELVDVS